MNHEEEFDVFRRTDFISSELTSFTGYNNRTVNMILTLTIKPFNVINGTNITCEIDESLLLLSPLYLAGIHIYTATWNRCNYFLILRCTSLHRRSNHIPSKETYFTAVLKLGDMFDGGGVLIDHYIIQLDNGTQLETPDPTHSFDIMYNTTLSVNISAHNCAGCSDPFPLDIEYHQG